MQVEVVDLGMGTRGFVVGAQAAEGEGERRMAALEGAVEEEAVAVMLVQLLYQIPGSKGYLRASFVMLAGLHRQVDLAVVGRARGARQRVGILRRQSEVFLVLCRSMKELLKGRGVRSSVAQ